MSANVEKSSVDVAKKPPSGSDVAERAVFHPLETLREEVDRLFEDYFTGFTFGPFGRGRFGMAPLRSMEREMSPLVGFTPSTDVTESETEYKVIAELPGMDEDCIEVTLSNGVLTIEGEKKEDKEETKNDFHMMERRYGSVRRTFRFSDPVLEDKIDATFENGVLTVTLPKKTPARDRKKISIKTR